MVPTVRKALRLSGLFTTAALAAVALSAHAQRCPAPAEGVQQTTTPSARDALIGVYTLVEYAGHGDQPTGRISYDSAGRMWAMLLPPGRDPVSSSSTPEEYRAAMRGLVAYYGTYEVDAATGRVIHHVEAASNPAWIGADFVRWYRLEDRNLTISLNPEFDNPLLWERLRND